MFAKVYADSGKVFKELEQFKEKFKHWIAPALMDFDATLERTLIESEDWNVAFNEAKKRKNEIVNLAK